jgi:5-formyltetrahydrofolate cyclo-ligase
MKISKTPKTSKVKTRKKLLDFRIKLSKKEVENLSKKIIKKLKAEKEFKKAKIILLYHPIKNEVDTISLLGKELKTQLKTIGEKDKNPQEKSCKKSIKKAHKKNIKNFQEKIFALPRICKKTNKIHLHQITDLNELQIGKFNIKEPCTHHKVIPQKDVDLIITPGIAFDKKGHRIGYGKGYFDRLFKTSNAYKIALAYDFQIIENVPAEKHDKKVDMIITEKRTIKATSPTQ